MPDNRNKSDSNHQPPEPSNWRFSGFALPTTTPVPDQFFDELLSRLAPTEVVVALYIIRRTFGFKKDSDNISLKQLADGITTKNGRVLDQGTGLSKATIARALKSLEEKGVILRLRRRSSQKGDEPTMYQLNILRPLYQNETPPVAPMRHGGVSRMDTQETVIQETELQDLSKFRKVSTPDSFDEDDEQDGSDHGGSSHPMASAESHRRSPVVNKTRATPSGFEPVGKLLVQKRLPTRLEADLETRDVVLSYIQDFSVEMGDEAKLSSSVTRALNLYHKSGVDLGAFTNALYEARRRTKEHTGTIRKRRQSDGSYAPKNKMPYFFGVLEQLLGLREDGEAEDTLQRETGGGQLDHPRSELRTPRPGYKNNS